MNGTLLCRFVSLHPPARLEFIHDYYTRFVNARAVTNHRHLHRQQVQVNPGEIVFFDLILLTELLFNNRVNVYQPSSIFSKR